MNDNSPPFVYQEPTAPLPVSEQMPSDSAYHSDAHTLHQPRPWPAVVQQPAPPRCKGNKGRF